MTRFTAAALLCLIAIAAASPVSIARAAATQDPVTIPVFAMPGALAATDAGAAATIEDAAAGRLPFRDASQFRFSRDAGFLRQTVVWIRIPEDPRWLDGGYSVETSFDTDRATLYAPNARGGWDGTAFGMLVPYANRAVARIVPTAPHFGRRRGTAVPAPFVRTARAPNSRSSTQRPSTPKTRLTAAQEGPQIFLMGVFVTLAMTNIVLFAFARSRMYLLYSVAMLLAAVNTATVGHPFAWKWFWPHSALPHYATLTFFGALRDYGDRVFYERTARRSRVLAKGQSRRSRLRSRRRDQRGVLGAVVRGRLRRPGRVGVAHASGALRAVYDADRLRNRGLAPREIQTRPSSSSDTHFRPSGSDSTLARS